MESRAPSMEWQWHDEYVRVVGHAPVKVQHLIDFVANRGGKLMYKDATQLMEPARDAGQDRCDQQPSIATTRACGTNQAAAIAAELMVIKTGRMACAEFSAHPEWKTGENTKHRAPGDFRLKDEVRVHSFVPEMPQTQNCFKVRGASLVLPKTHPVPAMADDPVAGKAEIPDVDDTVMSVLSTTDSDDFLLRDLSLDDLQELAKGSRLNEVQTQEHGAELAANILRGMVRTVDKKLDPTSEPDDTHKWKLGSFLGFPIPTCVPVTLLSDPDFEVDASIVDALRFAGAGFAQMVGLDLFDFGIVTGSIAVTWIFMSKEKGSPVCVPPRPLLPLALRRARALLWRGMVVAESAEREALIALADMRKVLASAHVARLSLEEELGEQRVRAQKLEQENAKLAQKTQHAQKLEEDNADLVRKLQELCQHDSEIPLVQQDLEPSTPRAKVAKFSPTGSPQSCRSEGTTCSLGVAGTDEVFQEAVTWCLSTAHGVFSKQGGGAAGCRGAVSSGLRKVDVANHFKGRLAIRDAHAAYRHAKEVSDKSDVK